MAKNSVNIREIVQKNNNKNSQKKKVYNGKTIIHSSATSENIINKVDYRIQKDESASVVERNKALQFRKLKEILMQNVSKNGYYSFYRYTKDLIKRYLTNPYTHQNEVREVSRYLFRTSTLYKKIILYHATMPLYNYTITQKNNVLVDGDYERIMREYQKVIKRLNAMDIRKDFINMMTMLMLDGVYYGFMYSYKEDGAFIQQLDPRYCKISGKNEAGMWIVYFDASYFSVGTNIMFVEPQVEGQVDGLWDQVFRDGWENYKKDRVNNRWFQLPTSKTICAISGPDAELAYPQPFFEGIFIPLLDVLDYEQLTADRAVLENYVLLVSKIPLIDGSDRVDDFAVSLELVKEMQDLIDNAVPDLVGTAFTPLDIKAYTFNQSNSTNDVNMIADSINNVFTQAGASQLAISGGDSTNAIGLKQAIANDMAITFMHVGRLESNFSYWIKRNITEHVTFKIHRETWYNRDEYIKEKKDAATLGGSALDYLTALDMTPYEAFNQLLFENKSGIKDIMIPLRSSWSTSWEANGDIDANTKKRSGGTYDPNNVGGRPIQDEVSESGEEARNEGRVEGVL